MDRVQVLLGYLESFITGRMPTSQPPQLFLATKIPNARPPPIKLRKMTKNWQRHVKRAKGKRRS
jgi:hypothetical protein